MALTPSQELRTDRIVHLLSFQGIVDPLLEGKRVTRLEWGDKRIFYHLSGGIFSIHKAGEALEISHPVALNDGDLLGKDWIILED